LPQSSISSTRQPLIQVQPNIGILHFSYKSNIARGSIARSFRLTAVMFLICKGFVKWKFLQKMWKYVQKDARERITSRAHETYSNTIKRKSALLFLVGPITNSQF
jgi:hypothetical protein